MNNNINIAYTIGSEQHIYWCIISCLSILRNNKNNLLNFYIVHDSTIDKSFLELFNFFENFSNCNSIVFFNTNFQIQSKFNKGHNELLLLNVVDKIKSERLLLLSSFSIVNNDLSELYNIDLKGNICAATEYILPEPLKSEAFIERDFIINHNTILFDTNKLKLLKPKDFLLSFSYKLETVKDTKLGPLEIYNILLRKCLKLDLKYNYTEIWYKNKLGTCSTQTLNQYNQFKTHIDVPCIINFAGPKPTNPSCKNSYTNLWWKYAEQTPIYEEIKQFRQLNKYKLSATSAQNSFNYGWLLSRIWPYIKPYWFRILVGFAISIPLGLLDGVTALALKPYMDYVVGNKALEFSVFGHNLSISSMQMAWILPIGIILFAAVQGVLRYLNAYLSAWVSRRITNDVKFDLFHKLINMHPQFFDDNSSGIVISRYMSDPNTASSGIVDNIRNITTSLCGALGLIAVMIYSSWQLAFVGVLILCVAFIPVALIRKRIRETSNKNMVIGGKITTNTNETYSGNKVMAAYGLQERQEQCFRKNILDSFSISMALTKRTAWMSPLMYQIASIGIAAVLGYGTYLISIGQMTAGAFASFVTSLLLLYKPVKSLGGTLTGIQNIFVAMGRVFELFDLDSAIKDSANPQEMQPLKNEIRFENVEFEYVPNKPVLRDINLTVPKNETLAIVGNSGGGKSTLVNLIPRFYDIKSGSIKFDGIDIKDLSIKSLRKNISMVFQDNFLFSGTIKDNIMMGNPEATTEELMDAIKAAHLQDMIAELPDGLDTELGERGLTLSGGQRQRVAIARAMLRNAPIVILDEATSALDNESEAIVQKAMDNLMKNRTVFIIAHRLSTIKNADRIAVINEGELVELGTHDELMQIENGQYKALYEMQFRSQEVAV